MTYFIPRVYSYLSVIVGTVSQTPRGPHFTLPAGVEGVVSDEGHVAGPFSPGQRIADILESKHGVYIRTIAPLMELESLTWGLELSSNTVIIFINVKE